MSYDVSLSSEKWVANSGGIGTIAWTSANAVLTGGSAWVSLGSGQASNYFWASSLGLSTPVNLSFDGVMIGITGRADSNNSIQDSSVRLIQNGTVSSVDSTRTVAWGTANARFVYGGSTQGWGFATWNSGLINNSNTSNGMGMLFAVSNISAASATFYVTAVTEVNCHYSVTDLSVRPVSLTGIGVGRF